jgi:hypothetical protein
MSDADGTPRPIVELKPGENEPPAMSAALRRRIRQQEILAELGVTALQGASLDQLMSDGNLRDSTLRKLWKHAVFDVGMIR